MKEIDLEQGTSEWLAWRKNKITASIAPIIMGDSHYRKKQQLWREMMDIDPPQFQNEAMKRGNELEPLIRRNISFTFGTEFIPKVFQSSKYEWLGCSVDGFSEETNMIIEIKTCGREDFDLAKMGKVPKKYKAQIQTILAVCNAKCLTYVAYHNDTTFSFQVDYDHAYIDDMIPKLKAFWDSLQNFEQPEGKHITNEEEVWINHTNLWKNLQIQKKELLMQEEILRSALLSMSGGKNMKGNGLKITGIKRKGAITYSDIIELQGIDLEKYRGPEQTIWRIENDHI